MKQKTLALLALVLCLSLCLSGIVTASAEGSVTTIRAYLSDSPYNHNIIAGFEAENPDIKVEIVPVDFNNAEQVIKTSIASGNPVDVSFFWGTQINVFTESDMALDLTDYLMENDGEWYNTFVPAYIDGGKYGVNVVTNALFIPANAKHPEEAVRFIKYYTSDAGIAEIIKSGRLPSTLSMQDKVDSKLTQELLATTVGANVVGYEHIQNLSSEISAYVTNDLVSGVCTGLSVDDVLQGLEDLRLAIQQTRNQRTDLGEPCRWVRLPFSPSGAPDGSAGQRLCSKRRRKSCVRAAPRRGRFGANTRWKDLPS